MGIFDGYLLVSDMDGTLLNSNGKLSEENKKAIEYFVDNGGQFTLATGRMLPYIYQSCKRTERFNGLGYDIIYDIDDSIWNKKWTKALIVGEKEELDFVETYLKENYGDKDIVRSSDVYLEIIPKGVSKGQDLKELVIHEGLEEFKIISVGDNMNDVELLEEAHYGFCIANGSEELKKKSKYIAPSNDDNPIEFIIKWLQELK